MVFTLGNNEQGKIGAGELKAENPEKVYISGIGAVRAEKGERGELQLGGVTSSPRVPFWKEGE